MSGKPPDQDRFRQTRAGYAVPHEPRTARPTMPNGSGGFDGKQPSFDPIQPPSAPVADAPVQPAVEARGSIPSNEPRAPGPPPIEVEYVRERDGLPLGNDVTPLLEIWTRNRIYHVDAKMICVSVVDRATSQTEAKHPLLGARLTGGERRSKTSHAVELVFPLPVPGTEAVFRQETSRHGQYGKTSLVERVVMRVRKVRVGAAQAEPSWDEVTGRFQRR